MRSVLIAIYKGRRIEIFYDGKEKSKYKYIAQMPTLDGATQGSTEYEALEMAKDYIDNVEVEKYGD